MQDSGGPANNVQTFTSANPTYGQSGSKAFLGPHSKSAC